MEPNGDLSTLAAREAIATLRADYAWHLDHGNWGEWAGLFTRDTEIVLRTATEEVNRIRGREDVRRFGEDLIEDLYEYSMHLAGMPRIEIEGEEASGTWYFYVHYEWSDGPVGWLTGEYRDTYHRVDGDWRFARMVDEAYHDSGAGAPHMP